MLTLNNEIANFYVKQLHIHLLCGKTFCDVYICDTYKYKKALAFVHMCLCSAHLCSSHCPGWPHSEAEQWLSSQPWCCYQDPGCISQAKFKKKQRFSSCHEVEVWFAAITGWWHVCECRTVSPGSGLSFPASAEALASCMSFSRPLTIDRALSISKGPHASCACEMTVF